MANKKHHLEAEPFLERLFFNNRPIFLVIFLALTVVLSYFATQIRPDASFFRMVPQKHEYIQNMLGHWDDVKNLGNVIRISVENKKGTIFDADYLKQLEEITQEVSYLPGVNRIGIKSLWTANVRWIAVTEEGFEGGTVIPDDYDGTERTINKLRINLERSGQIGQLVANDFRSAIVYVPLEEINPETGEKLDYQKFSEELEAKIRDKYASESINIYAIGIAKKIGDLIDGFTAVIKFFVVAIAITFVLLVLYFRCLRSSIAVVVCSLIAVIWLMGIIKLLGYGIDPYSMLVPFLVFAIGVSHAVQIINSMAVEASHDEGPLLAAKRTFRGLYVPGMLALVSDAIGFLTLLLIEIEVIQGLAVIASVGVATVLLTNIVLLPIIMSYIGVSETAKRFAKALRHKWKPNWHYLSYFASHKIAPLSVVVALILAAGGWYYGQDLKIGDLDKGAPELQPDSRYNKDIDFVTSNYSTSADVLVIMLETGVEQCASYKAMEAMDRLEWRMKNVEGVQQAISSATVSKRVVTYYNEGNLKWSAISRTPDVLNSSIQRVPAGMINGDCSLSNVFVFLNDHKAETLERVVKAADEFVKEYNDDDIKFLLAGGNSGIDAATNQVIAEAEGRMLFLVYAVVSLLVFITFRSIRTVICIVAPLALTSVLCQALMAHLGIGVKVATLPVIALGVGIGVDYGIYIYSRLEEFMKMGIPLREAYYKTLKHTGKAVSFTGLTLAVGVGTWYFSPIKFQADMGILLVFMFIWNMFGAIALLPALARFLIKSEPTSKAKSVRYA